jgi:pyrroline-5-carboxylate reductase
MMLGMKSSGKYYIESKEYRRKNMATKIAMIGGGAMGEAIIGSLLRINAFAANEISVAEPDDARRNRLKENFGVNTFTNNVECAANADVIVLAVKPQIAPFVLRELKGNIPPSSLVFSIMAGVTTDSMREVLGDDQPIVRTIPNTPAQIGQGMTAWTRTPSVSATQLDTAKLILRAMGEELMVASEKYIDMATAINGSGPAYVFLILEAMIDAGVHLGFTRPEAEKLVLQTVKGSVEYALQSNAHLAQLRNQVTSPGGTTAAGLYELEQGNLRTTLANAIWAAYRRSVELGK